MMLYALICARGGSKGLPGKNIRPLAGKPLIVRAIEQASALRRVDTVIVSTDSEEIADIARTAGAEVPYLRPADLARDDSPEWLVWRHAISHFRGTDSKVPDALIIVPVTAPLRSVDDLDRCIDEFEASGADAVITVCAAHRNPYFNMVRLHADGSAAPVIESNGGFVRRQDAPPVFDMTTVAYVVRTEFVMQSNGLFDGNVRCVEIPVERAIDIDTPLDFKIAECLLQER